MFPYIKNRTLFFRANIVNRVFIHNNTWMPLDKLNNVFYNLVEYYQELNVLIGCCKI